MKSILASTTAAAILFMSPAAHSEDRDPFVGEYAGQDCDAGIQCWLEIEKTGKVYKLAFVAADRMDASKELCRFPFKMKRGPFAFDQHQEYDDVLSGDINGSPTFVDTFPGGVSINGGYSAGNACGRYFWFGTFVAFSDY